MSTASLQLLGRLTSLKHGLSVRGSYGRVPTTAVRNRNISTTGSRYKFRLTYETMNSGVVHMEYAVRGQIPQEAKRIEADLKGVHNFPFEKVLYCNSGDAHASGQQPLTFVRQLLAACTDPSTMSIYPKDVVERAELILERCPGNSIGSYSDSSGIEIIRKHVAEFISRRDGVPCDFKNVYLVNGASDGIKTMLFMVTGGTQGSDTKAGVLLPIPVFPLYNAALTELGAYMVGYKLDEDRNWAVDVSKLKHNLDEARKHCEPRIMVVINPGNPTGQYLAEENVKDIIRFCHDEGLMLFTDEVYQENIYVDGVKFQSFHKLLRDMGPDFSDFQLISFNSTSKGYFGECGFRGGYMQMVGLDELVMMELLKHVSVSLCPNTLGQVVTDALVNPPVPGDPSYDLYQEEMTAVISSLRRKARLVYQRMNSIPGIQCNEIQGSMEAFPRVDIPHEAWDDARREDPTMELDTYYCLELLRQTGVCVVPGSGFGQREGTWHFRTTILPPETDLHDMLNRFENFHIGFLDKYG